jgi:hypothetical protein
MLPIRFYTNKKIFNYYSGLSFFIFIWILRTRKEDPSLKRHEVIHFWQQVELLFIFHWLLYGIFYLISRFHGQGHYQAYRTNPFECEAYDMEEKMTYLKDRRPFAWAPYVRKFFAGLRAAGTSSQKVGVQAERLKQKAASGMQRPLGL